MNLKTIVNSFVGLSLLGGCATANLLPGETLNSIKIEGFPSVDSKTYKTTDESERQLRTVMGIKKGTMSVNQDYNGNVRVSGILPNFLSDPRTFDELYVKADTNGDGAVDTPEANVLYQKTLQEVLKH